LRPAMFVRCTTLRPIINSLTIEVLRRPNESA